MDLSNGTITDSYDWENCHTIVYYGIWFLCLIKKSKSFAGISFEYSKRREFGYYDDDDRDYKGNRRAAFQKITSTKAPPAAVDEEYTTDDILNLVAYKVLIPIVVFLIMVCFAFGIFLIVKSYTMAPVKPHLATAIVRRRRSGYAPENDYIPQAEMRASARFSCSDRKSMPPLEVLRAARARAAEIHHV